jgi:hypothetical protein
MDSDRQMHATHLTVVSSFSRHFSLCPPSLFSASSDHKQTASNGHKQTDYRMITDSKITTGQCYNMLTCIHPLNRLKV